MNNPLIETERLLLREITEEDLNDLLEIWGDPEAMRLFPQTLNRDEMKAWIERNNNRYKQFGHGIWAVVRKSDGLLVGDCGLVMQEVDGVDELEVGYHFKRSHWGNGYATEAARSCMEYAFNQLGRRRVISMIRPENLPSRRVAERNGLQIEKQIFWRGYDHYVYSIVHQQSF
ncbi:MAG: GNAT family N-acetyltransferase [Acidobacteriota bacterium]